MKCYQLILFVLLPFLNYSQIKNGVIHYKVVNNAFLEDSKTSYLYSETDKKIITKVILELKFNENESSFSAINLTEYTEEQFQSGLRSSSIAGYYSKKNNSNIFHFYKNDQTFGKIIIEEETLLNWELKNEFKFIDGYKCYKAVTSITDYNYVKNPISEMTAWYCPQIPLKHGPKRFSGLPGLIFEITERNITIQISKINLDTKDPVSFTPPFKGKYITPLEYKKLIEDYIEEMQRG